MIPGRTTVRSDFSPPRETHRVRGIAVRHQGTGERLTSIRAHGGARDADGNSQYVRQLSIELEGLGDDAKFLRLQLNRDLIGRNYKHIMGDAEMPAHTVHKK
ncbi:hypothetical protein AMAG_19694 [Allomyces macrogynus ATCC 38327]|uniref:Uncharacterized protein n=1 Tax=Allomyces macrogynus (strain ATCC 38327) TaxID=578462 RepID=A0A0L0SYS8_ALLM3|nr:hypothetical protein AMAG_19694 [Allomyces macrogynus ATCC 38327]|eukprot:KNE67713.1 hypothetical protein AMAG_19694 [Allomyces macrogynus ATCC 38327]